jgi:hypothetical protein
MTIIEYVLAQVDARKRAEARTQDPRSRSRPKGFREAPTPQCFSERISIAWILGGRAYTQRDARRKWARAA